MGLPVLLAPALGPLQVEMVVQQPDLLPP
eukprot:COSAG01_NODE_75917_length_191_cov_330.945652_2_plen_28_part_01